MSCSTCIHRKPDDELGPYCDHPKAKEQSPVGLDLNVAVNRFCGEARTEKVEAPEVGS
jgi:hypothetical protein